MATHRITLTTVGSGIADTLNLYYWNGSAWVLLAAGVPKSSLVSGYQFNENTGATRFKLVDTGVCATELEFNCGTTTTTTQLETTTTTEEGTTTTTTFNPSYTLWIVGNNYISKSEDAGKTWEQKYSAPNYLHSPPA